ncbi:HigA family addiction module antidote protein [Secundilactobacillus kimchicus]|uniref:HigA family addiction module antitoxin n=1 Tax=Secundilactobacillus kimchicus TaxID=528209 RepID=UPI001C00C186|nr:HigA family addiction module antitoxin [Secundilactobacillus kimchicus]MBT9672473.1 HigA family addiction module antidote protein [Secundilactobacillus kimchicus]
MANKMNILTPNYVTKPGDTLKETIKSLSMTQHELAERTGFTPKHISEIVNGKAQISPKLASALEMVLDVPASFWNNLEANYQQFIEQQKQNELFQQESEFSDYFNYQDMVHHNFVPPAKDKSTRTKNLLKFFRFPDFDTMQHYFASNDELQGAYRIALPETVDQYALKAWIQKGRLDADQIATNDFDKMKLKALIPSLRELTLINEPQTFISSLQKIMSNVGIAIVFVPELKGSHISGFTTWLSPFKRVIIELSARYKTNDTLWFTLFHELAHLILHNKKSFITFPDKGYDTSSEEQEADAWASQALIPQNRWEAFIQKGRPTRKNILTFAESVGIHPGIVVGRLQKFKIIPYSYFNDLKVRYKWEN